jgi:hypothetical protein
MDIQNVSPMPWVSWHQEPTASNGWAGKAVIAGLPLLSIDRSPCFRKEDAEFICLARTAFDIMLRRKWNPSYQGGHNPGWFVCDVYDAPIFPRSEHHVWQEKLFDDPFTALVEAERAIMKTIEFLYTVIDKTVPETKGGPSKNFWSNHPDWDYFVRTNVRYSKNNRIWLGGGGKTVADAIASATESVELDAQPAIEFGVPVSIIGGLKAIGKESPTFIKN